MKGQKKLLFITNKAPHYRLPLFNKLSKQQNTTFLFTNEEKHIKDLKAKQIISKGVGCGKLKINMGLIKEISEGGYDFVFMLPPDASHLINNYLLYFACKKETIPFIFWTERWQYFQTPFKDKLSNFFHKFLLRRAHKVLVAGKKSNEWVKLCEVKKSNIIIAPNASEIAYNKEKMKKVKKALIKKYNLKNKRVILYLGRLISRKGIRYLIEAFSKLKNKNTVLMIVGGGDFYKLGENSVEFELKKQVDELNLKNKIIFTGEIEHSKTAAYYSLADIFVYPSITENISEPWGLTLNEAMQFGLPVVSTTAVGAAYDLIENGKNGFVAEEKSSDGLRKVIGKILNDDKLRTVMGRESKRKIRTGHGYDKMLDGFLEAIE